MDYDPAYITAGRGGELLSFRRPGAHHELDYRLSYLATHHDAEIDLILSRGREHVAIEIKSGSRIDPIEVRKLDALAANLPGATRVFHLSRDPSRQKHGRVRCLPWRDVFAMLD